MRLYVWVFMYCCYAAVAYAGILNERPADQCVALIHSDADLRCLAYNKDKDTYRLSDDVFPISELRNSASVLDIAWAGNHLFYVASYTKKIEVADPYAVQVEQVMELAEFDFRTHQSKKLPYVFPKNAYAPGLSSVQFARSTQLLLTTYEKNEGEEPAKKLWFINSASPSSYRSYPMPGDTGDDYIPSGDILSIRESSGTTYLVAEHRLPNKDSDCYINQYEFKGGEYTIKKINAIEVPTLSYEVEVPEDYHWLKGSEEYHIETLSSSECIYGLSEHVVVQDGAKKRRILAFAGHGMMMVFDWHDGEMQQIHTQNLGINSIDGATGGIPLK
ncbi:MAG: hypothetical protein KDK51_06340 [Deltaproteobacteria bacterium]|nr:hypothetical protein [Deltaproteobacteria bacterium]